MKKMKKKRKKKRFCETNWWYWRAECTRRGEFFLSFLVLIIHWICSHSRINAKKTENKEEGKKIWQNNGVIPLGWYCWCYCYNHCCLGALKWKRTPRTQPRQHDTNIPTCFNFLAFSLPISVIQSGTVSLSISYRTADSGIANKRQRRRARGAREIEWERSWNQETVKSLAALKCLTKVFGKT